MNLKLLPFILGVGSTAIFAFGASQSIVKSSQPVAKAKVVTYADDIAPILNRQCVSCHRPGEVAPFSLLGYENAKKWAPMVANVTEKGIMPPWKAVHGFGEFRDENRLTKDQVDKLREWSFEGTLRGDKSHEPLPPHFPSGGWSLGTPDLVLQPTKAFKLDAEGPDVYRNFVMHTNFKDSVWVSGIEVKPGNKKVVHHVITYLDGNRAARKLEEANTDGQEGYTSGGGGVGIFPTGSLGGWAPGLQTRLTSGGIAYLVKPGTDLIIQVHYHRSGKPETDLTRVGVYFAKGPVTHEMELAWTFNFNVNIPPGDNHYMLRRERQIPADITLYSAMPHMHLLGKSMKAWIQFPDGSTKPLVYVDNWDFNWQLNYVFKEPIHVPKGSKEIVEAVYDNSADNPKNPNRPPKRVTWGEQTTDEMFLLLAPYTVDGKPGSR